MTTWTKLTATLMSVLVIATTALAAEASMDHLVISVNPKILRPTTQPNLFGALTLKAIDAHGTALGAGLGTSLGDNPLHQRQAPSFLTACGFAMRRAA
jgi:hypothetical protein